MQSVRVSISTNQTGHALKEGREQKKKRKKKVGYRKKGAHSVRQCRCNQDYPMLQRIRVDQNCERIQRMVYFCRVCRLGMFGSYDQSSFFRIRRPEGDKKNVTYEKPRSAVAL